MINKEISLSDQEFCFSSLPDYTLANDSRLSLRAILEASDNLFHAGWKRHTIYQQYLELQGHLVAIPVFAYESFPKQETPNLQEVVITGIHGTEPDGPNALTLFMPQLKKIGETEKMLVFPLCNLWGYFHNIRMSQNNFSVGDTDHFFGRVETATCHEAKAMTDFLLTFKPFINNKTRVLNLHTDQAQEWPENPDMKDEDHTYIYVAGSNPAKHPITLKIVDFLKNNNAGLKITGKTRFGETIENGLVVNTQDGSVDELLALLGASPVITVEYLVSSPVNPPLSIRTAIYQEVLKIFFQLS